MNEVLIDTDTPFYFLNGNKLIVSKIEDYLHYYDQLTFSEITYFEVLAGLEYKKAKKKIEQFELFSLKNNILRINTDTIKISARIYGELRRKGIVIGTPDLLIGGIALYKDIELITNNEKHYKHIELGA